MPKTAKNAEELIRTEYETSDFYFAVYLKALEFQIAHAKKAKNRLIFIMRKTIPIGSDISGDYYSGKALINPLLYSAAQKELKKYIYDGDGKKILEGSDEE